MLAKTVGKKALSSINSAIADSNPESSHSLAFPEIKIIFKGLIEEESKPNKKLKNDDHQNYLTFKKKNQSRFFLNPFDFLSVP